ncbi:MAG: hypothetical protein IKH82_00305 [Clostridiales bacterium]|nr:hypothetical protein [Clostridiales bacterium]
MPHSSGGGSHGGGFHGGSHGGSSRSRVSSHYFPGARRYLKHNRSTGADEYVYSNTMPQKAGKSIVAVVSIMVTFFLGMFGFGIASAIPKKLNVKYADSPAIHDDLGIIGDEYKLLSMLNEYQALTGICTDIYTTYDEYWLDQGHYSLESFSYNTYTDSFSDEQHFVIVYSIPQEQIAGAKDGTIRVPDFAWEATQGDETDPIITAEMFEDFGEIVQDDLERGKGPATAFEAGFKYALKNAHSKLDSDSPMKYINLIGLILPMLFVGGICFVMMFLVIKAYRKDKNIEYSEVPLDAGKKRSDGIQQDAGTYTVNKDGGVVTVTKGNGYYSKSVHYDLSDSNVPKKVRITGYIFMGVFAAIGLLILAIGIGKVVNKGTGGPELLEADDSGPAIIFFGALWTIIILITFISSIVKSHKSRKAKNDTVPLTAEYPDAEYPDMTKAEPVHVKPVQQDKEQEFDPEFFPSAKSDYEDDDEDFKRKKRQGYE